MSREAKSEPPVMPLTEAFEQAFTLVQVLAKDFEANKIHFLSPSYQESEVRKDFIDKLLIALGWDVNHDRQKNPFEQEVKVERGVSVHGSQRRADYAFYVAPNFRDVRFFVEAKKPFGDIATSQNCFQIVRYGWNSQTPVAILTDFEQFHIMDCRYKPNIDSALTQCIRKFHYSDYTNIDAFAFIFYMFSRDAVANGSIEKFTATLPTKRGKAVQRGLVKGGYQGIDEAFLEDLDEYRDILARAFKNNNATLDGETLTELTQRTIDRLVFMRFIEDKGIYPANLVGHFGDKGNAWQDFVATSRRLDSIYNGIVFKRHDILDASSFKIDDDAFAGICKKLAHINSPYDFNSIPIHILGSIYEQFLGKVIVTTDKRARLEEKPEVRKAGGVYYTPEYIVRYIVDNTVGKLIKGKSPAQIENMRFADIACGSGSFLLGIFDAVLLYHTKWFNDNPEKAKKAGCVLGDDGAWHLSLNQRRHILVNNIYGVDIDNQAVEVAQLSLYLKLLQEETTASARQDQQEFHETLLPSLNKNIVCGNSLIGTDVSAGQLFARDEERKLNPMDFEQRFPGIMKAGGFDAIVGNPPYVRIQGFPRHQLDYFATHYVAATGNFDLYVSFIERGFKLLKSGGVFGQIVPNKFFKTDYGVGLRQVISSNSALQKVVDFGASQVFEVTIYTCLLFLAKNLQRAFLYATSQASPASLAISQFRELPANTLTAEPWGFGDKETRTLLEKLKKQTVRLLDLPAEISRGSSTGNDEVFMVADGESDLEPAILRTPLFASDFGRYRFHPHEKWKVIFPYKVEDGKATLMDEAELIKRFPNAYTHLLFRKSELLKRKQFTEWFGYSAPRNLAIHELAQICIPLLADRGLFALIPPETRSKICPMASGGFTVSIAQSVKMRPEYVLGLLNSRLLFWQLGQTSNIFRGGWITCTKQYFGELPIRQIDFSITADKSCHDRMVALVEQMLAAKPQLAEAQSDKDKDFYVNKCGAIDRQIDALVYELYGLTPEEIDIVEGTTAAKCTEPTP
jgi:hypothetical protein